MRIMLAGDTHTAIGHWVYLLEEAEKNDVKLVIQLGDFGFWPKEELGRFFLEFVNSKAAKMGIEIWWLDGNHEDHKAIEWMGGRDNTSLKQTKYDLVVNRSKHQLVELSNIYYLPRGFTFELGGITFMSYGGAFSVDRSNRKKNLSWFEEEIIDLNHVRSLPDQHIDVLLSHDCPVGYNFGWDETKTVSMISRQAREALKELADKITPYFVFSGHHHMNASYFIQTPASWSTLCTILNCDSRGNRSWYLLDTDRVQDHIARCGSPQDSVWSKENYTK